jgi:hypothetical protein
LANPQSTANQSALDQLTAAATAPQAGIPAPVASGDATTNLTDAAPPLASAPATVTGSTANLESENDANSPSNLAANVAATKTEEQKDHPSFLHQLGRVAAGAVGIQPGELDTPEGKGKAVMSILNRIGTAGTLAMGTPEQKQLAVEQEQIPLKMAQIRNEQEYRKALTTNNANKTGILQQNADTNAQKADQSGDLENAHARQIEAQMNGQVLVTPEAAAAAGDKTLAGKSLGAMEYLQRVTNPINNQLKASGGTKTVDLGADGVWGYNPLLGKTQRLGDSPSVARGDSMLKRTQLPVNDNQGNTIGYVNPQTKTFTAISDIHGSAPGAPSLSSALGGNVVPPKPTSSMLTMGQMAQTIQAQVPQLKQEVADLGDKVGATGGRWNDFWVKKGGINDPAYAGVDQDLQLYATALGKAHFGASMPEAFVKDMMRDFSLAQSPEDLQARIDHAEGWVNGYASRIGGKMPGKTTSGASNSGGGFSSTVATPNAGSTAPAGGSVPPKTTSGPALSFKDWKASQNGGQ